MKLRPAISIIVLLSFVSVPVHAAFFTDTHTSVYEHDIEELVSREIVQGYGDGTYRPFATINRAEFLKILMDSQFPKRQPTDLRCFADLEVQVPQWYARTTCAARELGIVSGYPDGSFRPDQPVLFVEALKMAFLTFGVSIGTSGSTWYEPYLVAARSRDILTSLLTSPAHKITRGEMASLTYALIRAQEDASMHPVPSVGVCGNNILEGTEQCDDGNNLDSDGCSSICILVPEPVRIAIVQIDQQTTGALSTVARGQKDVPLLKFTAVAGRQDAILTSLSFRPSVGSLLYAQHYELAMDRNNDGVYETIAQAEGKASSNRLIFDDMFHGGVVLPAGLSISFVVRADLVSTLGPVSLGLEFDSSLPDYVQAQGVLDGIQLEDIETDGSCPSGGCFIRVNTKGTTSIDIQQTGNLYVTQDTLPVRSHLLVAGSQSDEVLRLRLRSDGEDIDLKTLRIDGVPSTVESLLLFRTTPGQPTSGTAFAQASHGQCPEQAATRFCADLGLSTFVVSPSSEAVISVVAKLKNDQLGGVSGETMTLSLLSSTAPSSSAVEARGISSLETLAQNDGDGFAEGEIFIGTSSPAANIAMSGMPNDIALANINAVTNEGLTTSSAIPTGQSVLGSFKISAVPHTNSFQGQNDVFIKTLSFFVTAQNVQLDPATLTLSSKDDPATTIPCTGGLSTGTFTVTCTLTPGSIQYRISQGQSVTYRLSANVTNGQLSAGTSKLFVTLPVLGQRSTTNSIVWSDEVTTFQWVDIPATSVTGTIFGN